MTLPPSTDNRITIGGLTTAIGRIVDKSSKQFYSHKCVDNYVCM